MKQEPKTFTYQYVMYSGASDLAKLKEHTECGWCVISMQNDDDIQALREHFHEHEYKFITLIGEYDKHKTLSLFLPCSKAVKFNEFMRRTKEIVFHYKVGMFLVYGEKQVAREQIKSVLEKEYTAFYQSDYHFLGYRGAVDSIAQKALMLQGEIVE